jgi:hypothetical protein
MKKKLPEKASALLRIAVEDARKLQKTKGFKLNMRDWVAPKGKACEVCMAGAVMVCRLGVRTDRYVMPDSTDFEDALECINSMRCGRFSEHIDTYDADRLRALNECTSLVRSKYREHLGYAPWHVYLKCADILESVGL